MKKRILTLLLAVVVMAGMLVNPAVFSFAADDDAMEGAPLSKTEADAKADAGEKADAGAKADAGEKEDADAKAGSGAKAGANTKAKADPGEKKETNEESVAAIESKNFGTLQEAVKEANDGQTVKLLKDVTEYVEVSKSITIDLDGHTVTAVGASPIRAFLIDAGTTLNLKNGIITGGDNASGKDGAVTVSKGASLNAEKMTFTGNKGTSILNNGTADITDCKFTENNHEKSSSVSQMYILENRNKGKVTVTKSTFNNNNRNRGGIIYSGTSGCEMTLKSCDIMNNIMGEHGAVYIWYGLVRLVDTTVKGNTSTKLTGGLDVGNGDFEWNESAIYGNETTHDDYCSDDIYINGSIDENVVPLPKDMKDHEKELTGYVLMNADNSVIAEKPLSKDYFPHKEWAVMLYEKDEDICEYNGTKYGSIKEAVAAANGEEATIKLLKDAKCSESFNVGKGIVLDLNGYTLRGKYKKQSILRLEGDNVTIKNGKIAEAGAGGKQQAVYISCKNALVEDVEFKNNPNCALYAYRYLPSSKDDTDPHYITVKDCTFTNNLNREGALGYALSTVSYNVDVVGCTFKDNRSGVRLCSLSENKNTNHMIKMEDCKISGCKDVALTTKISTNHKVYIKGCEFFDNTIAADAEEESICLQEATSYGKANGGEVTFENCRIHDNKGAKYTVEGQSGTMQMKNCTIERNTAEISGGIYAGRNSFLYLVDTVIKNNRATGNGTTISGGISLFSSVLKPAPAVYVNGVLVSPQGTESNASYAGLFMQGGALYNNESAMLSPAADDLYVSKSCKVNVPKASEMKDGTYDFSGLQWGEDSNDQFEDSPAEKVASNRYYTVGSKTPKQVYIHNGKGENETENIDGNAADTDSENVTALGIGNDNNDGTKKRPVRTIKRALELADEYNVSNIITLSTIVPNQLTQEAVAPESADSNEESGDSSGKNPKNTMTKKSDSESGENADNEGNNSEEYVRVMDIGGKTITRDIGFLGVILDIDEPTIIRNTKINGNSERDAEMSGAVNGQVIKVTDTKLTLDEGTELKDNGITKTAVVNAAGIYAEKSDLTIEDDVLIDNMTGCKGGAVRLHNKSKLTMNGGKISNSTSMSPKIGISSASDFDYAYGGGVLLTRGSEMIMNGGEISGNTARHSGGGVSLGTNDMNSVNDNGGCSFTMKGGSLDGNKASVSGGGLFVQVDCTAEITAGDIINNVASGNNGYIVAEHAGGGIYVNGYHSNEMISWYKLKKDYGELKIKDVEIGNNTAEYEGSAIAFCGVGAGSLGKLEGTAIHDNISKGKGTNGYEKIVGKKLWDEDSDVFFDNVVFEFDHENNTGWKSVTEANELPHPSSMVGVMLNGASYDWHDMDGNKVSDEQLANITKVTKLKTAATATDKDMAESIAKTKVHINGNSSGRNAGGIGSNGRVAIGKTPDEPDEPEKPEEPKKPEEPEKPEKPETPDEPKKPETPNVTETPEKVTETTTTDKPVKPKTPGKPETPDKPKDKKTVRKQAEKVIVRTSGTGDTSDIGIYAGIAGLSGLILAAGILRRKKKEK